MTALQWGVRGPGALAVPGRSALRVRRRAGRIALVLATSLSVAWGVAQAAPAAADAHPAGADAAALLAQIQHAAEHLNYTGLFVHQEGSLIQTSRITHSVEAGAEIEKLEMLDGRIREYVRHGDDVQGYIPDRKLIVNERRLRREKFPALLAAAPTKELDLHYRAERAPNERVAGHVCDVTRLVPRDDLRYGYRLWVDHTSGLMLKVQTLDEHGEVLEQVAFTDIRIGGHIDRVDLRPSFPTTDGWHTEEQATQPASFADAGWSLTSTPAGFHPILEVKRTFGSGKDVAQIVLSDGLAAVSLFVEAANGPARSEGEASKGATNIITKALGSYWLTVVGEAPLQTVREVAALVSLRDSAAK